MKNNFEESVPVKKYTIKEEIANGITHGLGVLFGVAALTILLVFSIKKGEPLSIVSFSIYGACIILMYLSSTLYHSNSNIYDSTNNLKFLVFSNFILSFFIIR